MNSIRNRIDELERVASREAKADRSDPFEFPLAFFRTLPDAQQREACFNLFLSMRENAGAREVHFARLRQMSAEQPCATMADVLRQYLPQYMKDATP